MLNMFFFPFSLLHISKRVAEAYKPSFEDIVRAPKTRLPHQRQAANKSQKRVGDQDSESSLSDDNCSSGSGVNLLKKRKHAVIDNIEAPRRFSVSGLPASELADSRIEASQSFLAASKSVMLDEHYRSLVSMLVSFDNDTISIHTLVPKMLELLKTYPSLQSRFQLFLPKSFR
jgi:hypothetical protein